MTKRLGELMKVAREQTRRKHGKHARVEVLAHVCEAQQRGVFHPHIVVGYRTAADRAALDTFVQALKRSRGRYGFGTAGTARLTAASRIASPALEAGRYISKYLRPDGAKTSFVPLLEAVVRITPRDPGSGRHKYLLRAVLVSPGPTRITGVTMGFLRFCRRAFTLLKFEHSRAELVVMYRLVTSFDATFEGFETGRLPQPPPRVLPLLPSLPPPPLTLF